MFITAYFALFRCLRQTERFRASRRRGRNQYPHLQPYSIAGEVMAQFLNEGERPRSFRTAHKILTPYKITWTVLKIIKSHQVGATFLYWAISTESVRTQTGSRIIL